MPALPDPTFCHRVLIVGCGAVVEDLHVVPLQKLTGMGAVVVVGLVDIQRDRAEKLRKRFPKASIHTDLSKALKDTRATVCVITSPPGFHAGHMEEALAAGCHVLVEKPMVTKAEDASRLALRKQAGKVLAVAHPRRFFPQVGEVSQLIRNPDLTSSSWTFSLREGSPYNWPISTDAAFKRASSGGGVLIDKGVHALDVLDSLFGAGIVTTAVDDALAGGVEASCRLELSYDHAIGHASLSWEEPLLNGIHLSSSRIEYWLGPEDIATYRVRKPGAAWQTRKAAITWPASLDPTPRMSSPADYYQCAWFVWVNFFRAIRYGEAVTVDAHIAGRVLSLIEHAYKIAEPMNPGWMPETERLAIHRNHWRQIHTR